MHVAGVLNGNAHVIHIHGHHFQVLKVGWPEYNGTTKFLHANTPDIECSDYMCNVLHWTNASWYGGNIPGIIPQGAPEKDSVIVPAGGYVIVRFKADNPGNLRSCFQSMYLLMLK